MRKSISNVSLNRSKMGWEIAISDYQISKIGKSGPHWGGRPQLFSEVTARLRSVSLRLSLAPLRGTMPEGIFRSSMPLFGTLVVGHFQPVQI